MHQGLCRKLLEDTHTLLKKAGYAGAVLVPGEKWLFDMYAKMGYTNFGGITQFTAAAGQPIFLQQLTADEYAETRKQYLPKNGIRQEGENLTFFSTYAKFYCGENFVFSCAEEGENLMVFELLGNPDAAADIVATLGKAKGKFRIPGGSPFAMCHIFGSAPTPSYFGLAFD